MHKAICIIIICCTCIATAKAGTTVIAHNASVSLKLKTDGDSSGYYLQVTDKGKPKQFYVCPQQVEPEFDWQFDSLLTFSLNGSSMPIVVIIWHQPRSHSIGDNSSVDEETRSLWVWHPATGKVAFKGVNYYSLNQSESITDSTFKNPATPTDPYTHDKGTSTWWYYNWQITKSGNLIIGALNYQNIESVDNKQTKNNTQTNPAKATDLTGYDDIRGIYVLQKDKYVIAPKK